MAENENENPDGNTETEGQASEEQESTDTADQGAGDGGGEMSPEALRAALADARKEAAKYRTNARESREALAQATKPEDYQAVADKAAQLEVDLHKEKLARKYDLPEVVATRISGDSDEARDEDAKALAAVFHKGNELGSGGLKPGAKPTKTDPRALAASVPRSRR